MRRRFVLRHPSAQHSAAQIDRKSGLQEHRSLGVCWAVSSCSWRVLDALKSLKPETVIRWHRAGFRAYWRWKSRSRGGRPKTPLEVRQLIRDMSIENPLWGAPRIHGELLKLGIDVGQTTVCQVHGAWKASAIPRMEDVSSKSRGRHRVDGFVRVDFWSCSIPAVRFCGWA